MNTVTTDITTAELTSLLQLSQQVECASATAQSEQANGTTALTA